MPAGPKKNSGRETTFMKPAGKFPSFVRNVPLSSPFQTRLLAKMSGLTFAQAIVEIYAAVALFRSTASLQPARLAAKLI
jgi:hypothetical protein